MSAWQGEGIDEVWIRDEVKAIGKLAMRSRRQPGSNLRKVALDLDLLGTPLLLTAAVVSSQLVSDGNLFVVRHPREAHRHARQLLLGVSDQVQQGGSAGLSVHLVPLCDYDGRHGQQQDSTKSHPARHKYRLKASRFRVYRNETS